LRIAHPLIPSGFIAAYFHNVPAQDLK